MTAAAPPRPDTAGPRPPGPSGTAWGHLARYLRDPLGTLDRLAAEHGDVAYLRFPGGHDFFFVSDPALIRRVLVDDQRLFVKGRALQAAKRLLGEGLLTSEGAEHLHRRRLIQPLFHRVRIEAYAADMVAAAEDRAGRWHDGAVVDLNREMTELALAIVGRTIFDADVESEAPEIREVLEAGMRVFHRFLMPGAWLLWRLPLPATRRFDAARRDIDAFLHRLIAERRAQPGRHTDLLALLLEVGADGGEAMSSEEVRDEAVTLMLAGHETTAQALTWCWYLLASNPEAEAALHSELDRVLSGRPPGAADLDRLPYTRAAFAEALRLYPPVWALARLAIAPYELAGYAVPPGAAVVMSQWVVHRDGRHFADPTRFAPDRWLDGRPAPAAYFPFGGGSRICVGERFAAMEGALVLATIASRWRPRPMLAEPVTLDPRFTLRPRGGMPARLERVR